MTDRNLAPFYRNRSRLPRQQHQPIDSWSRGIGRRLLVEPTFESLYAILPLEMETARLQLGGARGVPEVRGEDMRQTERH
ncbi:unnamed protein product [Protopolystoma xenopodis]|uniref:Uncharacterized protein n=1 Tax=Protopolystoma xenopodis TaxID=117903 RepID=A0A3S5BPU1_9PLAT|nr:unnamed protein product [Protopolystoma xenopodis]